MRTFAKIVSKEILKSEQKMATQHIYNNIVWSLNSERTVTFEATKLWGVF